MEPISMLSALSSLLFVGDTTTTKIPSTVGVPFDPGDEETEGRTIKEKEIFNRGMADGQKGNTDIELLRSIQESHSSQIEERCKNFEINIRENGQRFKELEEIIHSNDFIKSLLDGNTDIHKEYQILRDEILKVEIKLKPARDRLDRYIQTLDPPRECQIADGAKTAEMVSYVSIVDIGIVGFLTEPNNWLAGMATSSGLYIVTSLGAVTAGLLLREGNAEKFHKVKFVFQGAAHSVNFVLGNVILSAAWLRETGGNLRDLGLFDGIQNITEMGVWSYGIIACSSLISIWQERFIFTSWKDRSPDYYTHTKPVLQGEQELDNLVNNAGAEIVESIFQKTFKQCGEAEQWSRDLLKSFDESKNLLSDSTDSYFQTVKKRIKQCNYLLRTYLNANAKFRQKNGFEELPEHHSTKFDHKLRMKKAERKESKTALQKRYDSAESHLENLTSNLKALEEFHAEKTPIYLKEIRVFADAVIAGQNPEISFTEQSINQFGGRSNNVFKQAKSDNQTGAEKRERVTLVKGGGSSGGSGLSGIDGSEPEQAGKPDNRDSES